MICPVSRGTTCCTSVLCPTSVAEPLLQPFIVYFYLSSSYSTVYSRRPRPLRQQIRLRNLRPPPRAHLRTPRPSRNPPDPQLHSQKRDTLHPRLQHQSPRLRLRLQRSRCARPSRAQPARPCHRCRRSLLHHQRRACHCARSLHCDLEGVRTCAAVSGGDS